MKFEIEAAHLAAALKRIKSSSGKDEILQHCMVRIDSGVADIVATDNTIQMSTTVDATGLCDGILLPLNKLAQTAAAHTGLISFECKDDKTFAKAGKSKYTIANLPAADFPEKPEFSERNEITIDAYTLACMIDDVSYAAAVNDVRFYLNGIHLVATGGALRVQATDGHRVAISMQAVEVESDFELIIPQRAVPEFRRLLSDIKDNAAVVYGNGQMMLEVAGTQLVTSLVDGKYPDIDRTIQPSDKQITIGREVLSSAANRALIFSNQKYFGARLSVSGSDLTLEADNTNHESAIELAECENPKGDEIEIGANLKYLLQTLKSIDADSVDIGFSEKQMIISPQGRVDVKNVIMAMKL